MRIYDGFYGTIDASDDGVVLRHDSTIRGVSRTNFRVSDATCTWGHDKAGIFHYPDETTRSRVIAAFVAAGGDYDAPTREFFESTRGMGVLWVK